VIQSGPFNASRLGTRLAAVITSNTRLATMPGNVFVPAAATGLPRDSVVNVTALVTLDQTDLGTEAGHLPDSLMDGVDRGLRRLLRTLHFGLRVADLGRSLAFYTAVGYEVVGTVPETPLGHLAMLRLPGDEFVSIELVHNPAQSEVSSGHADGMTAADWAE
jgi:mRNA interferase MazF